MIFGNLFGEFTLLNDDGFLESPRRTEEVRFELTKRFHVYTLSKRAPSATRTLLQEIRAMENNGLRLSAQV